MQEPEEEQSSAKSFADEILLLAIQFNFFSFAIVVQFRILAWNMTEQIKSIAWSLLTVVLKQMLDKIFFEMEMNWKKENCVNCWWLDKNQVNWIWNLLTNLLFFSLNYYNKLFIRKIV